MLFFDWFLLVGVECKGMFEDFGKGSVRVIEKGEGVLLFLDFGFDLRLKIIINFSIFCGFGVLFLLNYSFW